MEQKRKILFVVALLAILGGVAVVAATGPYWSPPSGPIVVNNILPSIAAAPTTDKLSYTLGDTITLTITVSHPTSGLTANFYYSSSVPSSSSPGTLINSSPVDVNSGTGIATTAFTPSTSGTYYFIAEASQKFLFSFLFFYKNNKVSLFKFITNIWGIPDILHHILQSCFCDRCKP